MQRIPEPELMDSEAQTEAYAHADFEEPNRLFVERFFARFGPQGAGDRALDLGCGPADITLRFSMMYPACGVHGADAGENMLSQARQAVERAGASDRVELVQCRLPDTGGLTPPYDAIFSNSLLHHLPRGSTLWSAIRSLGRAGGRVMVMDLRRPTNRKEAREIVERYSPHEPDLLKQDFENSLCAAFTPEEIAAQLGEHGLEGLEIEQPSDRHLLVAGELP